MNQLTFYSRKFCTDFTFWRLVSYKPVDYKKKENKCINSNVVRISYIKGGLSGQMTRQFLDVLELFSPYKDKLSNFRFRLIFIFSKK